MYDRIPLPLDGSEVAEAVEPHAMAMAKKFESEVISCKLPRLFRGLWPGWPATRHAVPSGTFYHAPTAPMICRASAGMSFGRVAGLPRGAGATPAAPAATSFSGTSNRVAGSAGLPRAG